MLTNREVVVLVFEGLIKELRAEEVTPEKEIRIIINDDYIPNKHGYSECKRIFKAKDILLILGEGVENYYLSRAYKESISIVKLKERDYKAELENSASYYRKSPIIALKDGGIISLMEFFGKVITSEKFNEFVIDYDYSDYEYNDFNENDIRYNNEIVDFLIMKIIQYINLELNG
jgi:hypothetical protein